MLACPVIACKRKFAELLATSQLGHGTKSLRYSPLRGGKSREIVASRRTAISGGKVTAINKSTVGV